MRERRVASSARAFAARGRLVDNLTGGVLTTAAPASTSSPAKPAIQVVAPKPSSPWPECCPGGGLHGAAELEFSSLATGELVPVVVDVLPRHSLLKAASVVQTDAHTGTARRPFALAAAPTALTAGHMPASAAPAAVQVGHKPAERLPLQRLLLVPPFRLSDYKPERDGSKEASTSGRASASWPALSPTTAVTTPVAVADAGHSLAVATVAEGQAGGGTWQRPYPASGGFRVSAACVSKPGFAPGYKDSNQDSCFAFVEFGQQPGERLFGVLDGHGSEGHRASGLLRRVLPPLLHRWLHSGVTSRRAFLETFAQADELLCASGADATSSGSTAVVVHLRQDGVLTAGWVGDSRAVIGRRRADGSDGWEAQDLTKDHKPERPSERVRVALAGGRVERALGPWGKPSGPYRVWLKGADYPGLAMSRAFGDRGGRAAGIIAEPEVSVSRLGSRDAFLLLASDGLWDFVSSEEAVQLAGAATAGEASTAAACTRLVQVAYERWRSKYSGQYIDDITAVLVRFEEANVSERQPLAATAGTANSSSINEGGSSCGGY